VRIIAGLLPPGLSNGLEPELSTTAMLFAAAASIGTVVVFGLAPAWRVSDANPALAMKVQARSSGGRAVMRFRSALTTAQIAFSMVLLVLAGLFTKSLMNVAGEDLGVDVDSLVSFSVTPRMNAYGPERLADFYDRLEEALAAQPGVVAVGSAGLPVLGNFALRQPFSVQGFEAAPGADTAAAFTMVSSDYFAALGVPLIAGRTFTDRDNGPSPPVAIVNATFARRFNVGTEPGKRLGFGATTTNYPFEIVGIVADSKHTGVKSDIEPVVYVSRYQAGNGIQAMFYYVRAAANPEALVPTIPRVVAEVDPDVPVSNLQTVTSGVDASVYVDRLLSMLSAGFAVLATLLAGIGLYGVLAYNVTQRTRELGLRLALGARPGTLRAMILKQVGAMAFVGTAVGLVAALALGRVAESMLFGLSGRDPLVLTAATAVLAVVVLAGSWLPARRASNIAPTEALRYE
jgi:predicted permease